MIEQRHQANLLVAVLASGLGIVLALLPLVVPHPLALMGLWLAQAPLALAASSAFAWRPRDEGWASRVGDMLATAVLYALPYLATAAAIAWPLNKIGRAHVCTPVPTAHLVCRLLFEKKKTKHN